MVCLVSQRGRHLRYRASWRNRLSDGHGKDLLSRALERKRFVEPSSHPSQIWTQVYKNGCFRRLSKAPETKFFVHSGSHGLYYLYMYTSGSFLCKNSFWNLDHSLRRACHFSLPVLKIHDKWNKLAPPKSSKKNPSSHLSYKIFLVQIWFTVDLTGMDFNLVSRITCYGLPFPLPWHSQRYHPIFQHSCGAYQNGTIILRTWRSEYSSEKSTKIYVPF